MSRGAYVLVFNVSKQVEVEVGRKRKRRWTLFGTYAYVGSAMNNLEKRIERHLKKEKRKHWHIDYVMEYATPIAVLLIESERRIEEHVSMLLARCFPTVPGFGASDVQVGSNLFVLGSFEDLVRLVSTEYPTLRIVHCHAR